MLKAAEFWVETQQQSQPIVDDKSLDGDVIIVAQATTISTQAEALIISTTNVSYLTRFL